MRRTSWLATSLVFVFALSLLGGAGCGKKPEKPGKSITLKVLLPQEDAKVEVDGKVYEGKGTERTLTPDVGQGKDTIEVKATWEPNNYTKITRPRKVVVKDGEITVDFRQRSDVEKDDVVVRWVPTPPEFVEAMCKMARVGKDDVVYDLGCGDGRMVIAAVKDFGARKGVGIDRDPDLVKKCQEAARKAGIEDRVEFKVGDVLQLKDVSEASVVLLYMGDDINQMLKPILLKTLKPGARVVSHRFLMGSDWPPERSETLKTTKGENHPYENQIHLWTIQPGITLLLPQDDALVMVDGQKIEGKGTERILSSSIAAGKETIVITAIWEPNNYTKITRPRKVVLKGNDITVDFRSPSDKEKDDIVVRFVPTPQEFVDAMCKMAKVTKDDVVYDLGCGDGRMVITAVKKFGAKRGVGVDIDPDLVKQCKEAAKKAGVADRVEFRVGDVLKVEDLSDATVVLLYMGDDINARLKPILKKTLKPGSRVVSHRFTMGEDWPPERTEKVKATYGEYPGYENEIHLWTIGNKQ
jgi:uncharacterized protein (TIGR03000 family)